VRPLWLPQIYDRDNYWDENWSGVVAVCGWWKGWVKAGREDGVSRPEILYTWSRVGDVQMTTYYPSNMFCCVDSKTSKAPSEVVITT
jgi:hypothetical protein